MRAHYLMLACALALAPLSASAADDNYAEGRSPDVGSREVQAEMDEHGMLDDQARMEAEMEAQMEAEIDAWQRGDMDAAGEWAHSGEWDERAMYGEGEYPEHWMHFDYARQPQIGDVVIYDAYRYPSPHWGNWRYRISRYSAAGPFTREFFAHYGNYGHYGRGYHRWANHGGGHGGWDGDHDGDWHGGRGHGDDGWRGHRGHGRGCGCGCGW